MHRSFTLFFLLFAVSLHAQITYESSDFIGLEESVLMSSATLTIDSAQTISTGQDHIWDFRGLPIEDQNIQSFFDPNNAGYKLSWCFLNGAIFNCDQAFNDHVNRATDFIDFNLAGFVVENAVVHYNLTETTFEEKFIGATINLGESPIPATIDLENVDTIYQFPLTFGQLDSSDRRFVADLSPLGVSASYSSTSHRRNDIDGWGKLITPYRTFNQTLRIRTTVEGVDTISLDTSMFVIPYRNVIYQWFDSAFPLPVLEITGSITEEEEVLNLITFIDSARCLDPNALFAFFPLNPSLDSLTESVTINFTNLSTGYDSVMWDFGDGTLLNEDNPSHTFTCDGVRNVTLIAMNTLCEPIRADTFSLPISPDGTGSLATQNVVMEEDRILIAHLDNVSYQWLNCQNGYLPIDGATSSTFALPSEGGDFALAIETMNGCVDTSICVVYEAVVSTSKIADDQLLVFPNPATDQLHIQLRNVQNIESVYLYTLKGVVIDRILFNQTNRYMLPSNLEVGLYILEVTTENHSYLKLIYKN